MATLRGWAPRGTRLTAKVPHGHWKTTTFLAALRYDRIEAPWVLEGPIDGRRFPRVTGARIAEVVLEPGEIIFMPLAWWHQVKSLDFSVTLTYTNFLWPNDAFATYPSG